MVHAYIVKTFNRYHNEDKRVVQQRLLVNLSKLAVPIETASLRLVYFLWLGSHPVGGENHKVEDIYYIIGLFGYVTSRVPVILQGGSIPCGGDDREIQ